ncbi:MAG: hypothetical protein HQ523_13435 [Lentisphaerae bacterium]|nr:hypothetical protein [Lentisphaerota bacterium]
MKRILVIVLAITCTMGWPGAAHATPTNDLSQSLVKLSVTAQEYDVYMPWQKREPRGRSGYAMAVGPHRFLTSEDLVRNATLIELQRPQSGAKLVAHVIEADYQIGLALLEVDTAGAPFVGLEVRPDRVIDETTPLQIVQLDPTLAVQTGDAQMLKVAMTALPSAPYPALLYTLLTDIAVNGHTAFVVSEDRLAGMVMQYNGNQRTAEIMPGSVIARFLEDAGNPPYAGFAMAGFRWDTLIDPAKRAYLGADGTADGILILSALPFSGAATVLRPNDVLLEWDGQRIDPMGYYIDPDLGRISLPHLIRFRRAPGDTVPLRVIRDRTEMALELMLSRHDDSEALIPENTLRTQRPYLIDGGLIICELTGHFLQARGGNWMRTVDTRLAQLYLTRAGAPEQPGDRVLILAGVLPDRINQDYAQFREEIITSVNGQPVRNIRDVYRVLGDDGHVERLGLQGIGLDLALDVEALPEANARIAQRYRIPHLRNPPPPLPQGAAQ